MNHPLSKPKFLSFSHKLQHKTAAKELKKAYLDHCWSQYRQMESWLSLPLLEKTDEAISDRYHRHLEEASLSVKEKDLLPQIKRGDSPSSEPFLPLHIYLDNLRSAHNVGSILRTTEAFRLGQVYFSKATPNTSNEKVRDASMGTYDKVSCHLLDSPGDLPRPIVVLETVQGAKSLFTYPFPNTFSLIVGNEEYGVSKNSQHLADEFVQIPLFGWKNSLNVATAFAIAAAQISNRARPC